jgi:hypothetical protein
MPSYDYEKDPDARLDYGISWSSFLPSGDTIAASSWDVPSGLTSDTPAFTTTATSIWLSGGTNGSFYTVSNTITTAEGRVNSRDFVVWVHTQVGIPTEPVSTTYIELEDLKRYLKISGTGDDAILYDSLNAAQEAIEAYCQRRFLAVEETRYYTSADVYGGRLWLDDDLLTVDTLLNGDGNELTDSYYRLHPRNAAPYHAIGLYSTASWYFDQDGEISVTGTWGFTETPDYLIKEATLWLASYFYHLKDSQVFDVTATPELGQITIPKGMPQQLVVHLTSLKRRRT